MSSTQIDQRVQATSVVEWPTWWLIIGVYGSWWLCLSLYQSVGPVIGLVLIFVCALHSSVQHELLHGHPTSSVAFNTVLAIPPLALFYPYFHYRESHLVHHNKDNLTMPGKDPESYYIERADWVQKGEGFQLYYVFYKTVFGRLLCGPAHSMFLLGREMLYDFAAINLKRMAMWSVHLLLVSLLLSFVNLYFYIPIWHYFVIAYCATSLGLVRSFFEHRPVDSGDHRSVIVETGYFFRLLFLNNNYHYVHHKYPSSPWYRLANIYVSNRNSVLQENGGFLVNGYSSWLLGHFFKPIDSAVHPFAVKEKSD